MHLLLQYGLCVSGSFPAGEGRLGGAHWTKSSCLPGSSDWLSGKHLNKRAFIFVPFTLRTPVPVPGALPSAWVCTLHLVYFWKPPFASWAWLLFLALPCFPCDGHSPIMWLKFLVWAAAWGAFYVQAAWMPFVKPWILLNSVIHRREGECDSCSSWLPSPWDHLSHRRGQTGL